MRIVDPEAVIVLVADSRNLRVFLHAIEGKAVVGCVVVAAGHFHAKRVVIVVSNHVCVVGQRAGNCCGSLVGYGSAYVVEVILQLVLLVAYIAGVVAGNIACDAVRLDRKMTFEFTQMPQLPGGGRVAGRFLYDASLDGGVVNDPGGGQGAYEIQIDPNNENWKRRVQPPGPWITPVNPAVPNSFVGFDGLRVPGDRINLIAYDQSNFGLAQGETYNQGVWRVANDVRNGMMEHLSVPEAFDPRNPNNKQANGYFLDSNFGDWIWTRGAMGAPRPPATYEMFEVKKRPTLGQGN